MLIAGRQTNVTRDGKLVALMPGQPVPEAAMWPHDVLMRCMKVGQIVNVEKPTAEQVQMAQASNSTAAVRATTAVKNAGQVDAPAKPLSTHEVNQRAAGKTAPAPKKSTSRVNAASKKAVA